MQYNDENIKCTTIIRSPLLEKILEKHKQSPDYEKMVTKSQKEDSVLYQDYDGYL